MKYLPSLIGVVFAIVLAVVIGTRLSPTARSLIFGVILGTITTSVTMMVFLYLLFGTGRSSREEKRGTSGDATILVVSPNRNGAYHQNMPGGGHGFRAFGRD